MSNANVVRKDSVDLIHDRLNEPSNVLLLAPSQSSHDDSTCMELLSVTDPPKENVLLITFTQTANDRLKIWKQHIGTLPAKGAIISVGEMTRSTASHSSGTVQLSDALVIDTVKNPGDLTGLGISISQHLETFSQDENQIVACFHSLTPLLQYADTQRVFRFLHVLTGRLKSVNAVAHFHMDPGAHDQQTISTLMQLFDAVIEQEEDGEWNVKTR